MTRSAGPDVLVAGAGPVGLLAAYELARRGVAVRLVDAATGPTATSRAIATHARTLEVYDQLGLLDRFLARGQVISGFSVFQGGRRLVRLEADYRATPTRRPFTLAIEQVATEAVLREAAAEVGVRPEWDTALATIEQDGDTVTVGLEHADGSRESVRVPWLVGCDGGHSTVRKLLDLRLHGSSNQTWLLADAPLAVDLPRDSIYFIRTGGATLMAVPLRDGNRWRLLDTVDVDDGGGPRAVADRFAAKLRAGLGRDLVVGDPTWVSVFTAQQRMVSGMRTGRCLVAGDAAHVHSPASGQGMNTGLQEAYNLAWKLAMVVHGYAGPGLLDTYPQERMPVGAALLASTERATDLIDLHNWFADLLLPVAMSAVRVFPPLRHRVQTKILSGISGLALSYADSALAADGQGSRDRGPGPGERLVQFGTELDGPEVSALLTELRDPRWSLLTMQGTGLPPLTSPDDVLSVHTVAPGALCYALGLGAGRWVLVRPDGYVAARGDSPATLPGTLASLPGLGPRRVAATHQAD